MFRKVSTLAAFLVILPALAWAQNSGKLAGTVVDKTTNDPLPGATVVIDGTQMGTATNANGEYFIIGVPVGKYAVRASFVGFEDLVYEGVEINSGYTRELNFALGEDVAALEELVVEYERPLIQKDAIGVPKIVSGEEIVNLPVRGVNAVAAIQGGVIADEGSGTLNIRGGRGEEVVYFVDGVKVIGNTAVAQSAILEQEMIIGSLPAKYGDAMSGVISISTKGGGSKYFGSLEGITSEVLDDFGYNLVSGSVGGPVIGGLSFFAAAEYQNQSDRDPRAVGPSVLKEDRVAFLNSNPEVLRFNTPDGVAYAPMPGDIAPDVDTNGDGTPDAVSFDRMMSAVGAGSDFVLDSAVPLGGGEVEDPANFIQVPSIPNRGLDLMRLNGNLTWDIGRDITIRGTGRYENFNRTLVNSLRGTYPDIALNSNRFRDDSQKTIGFGGSWTHRLSNSTFYQLTADFSTFDRTIHSPFFSDNVRDVLFVGDIDDPSNAIAARYKIWSAADSAYTQRFKDGTLPNREGIYSSLGQPGTGLNTYQRNANQQFRIMANATTQIGLNQIEFGGEFEQRTERRYIAFSGRGGIESAARFFNDGKVEAGGDGVDSWDEIPYSAIKENINYYGYNYLGTQEVNDQNIDTFVEGALGDCNDNPGSPKCNAAP
ncbi:MAG: carboxypeptidase-like regulatory domain-containing protein, partial [Rhodothermia bacterium]